MKVAGNVLFSRSVHPHKKPGRCTGYIVGFDTEYTSKGAELISIQLWHKDRSAWLPWPKGKKLTPQFLYIEALKLVGKTDGDLILVTYFSLAELQFLPVVSKGIQIREYSRGSLDVAFPIPGSAHLLRVFDLCRWFDGRGLAAAAKAMKLRKLDYDTKNVTRSCLRSKKFREYAMHDAYLCYEIMRRLRAQFMDSTNIDPLVAKTPASAAASAFRHKYIEEKFYNDSNRARYCACRGTWGGRAEAFARGKLTGQYKEYDFTSAYPLSEIRLGQMPIQGSWRQHKSIRALRAALGGFCEISFTYPQQTRYPGLPVYTKDAMIYPLSGRSWCTYEEAKQALEDGADIRLMEAWGYHHGTSALSDFLQWTLDERKHAVGAGKVMFKLLGNSIIGKLAQQISKVPLDELYRIAEAEGYLLDDMFDLTTAELIALGCRHMVSVGAIFMPEWNGLITGYTRAALAELVRTGNAVYCHTDSAWCQKRPSGERLPFDVKSSGPATVIRTRFASIGRPLSVRGVREGKTHVAHHSIWDLEASCKMLRGFTGQTETHVYEKRRPLKLRESVKTKRRLGEWVLESRRGSTAWCGKRRLLKDGTTAPWQSAVEYLDNRLEMRITERARIRACE